MEVIQTYKNGLILFRKTFLPLFMMTSVFPLFELLIKPSLENYLILKSFTVYDLVSFVMSLMVLAIGYITVDTLYKTGRLQIKEVYTRSVDVLWPLFLFQLIWMLFAGLFTLVNFLPPMVLLLALGAVVYLSVRVSMAMILIVVEKEGVAKAFDRSFVMTQGKFWNIFAVFALLIMTIFLIMIVLYLALLQPVYHVTSMVEMMDILTNSIQVQFVFYVFTMTIISQLVYATLYVVYLNLTHVSSVEDPPHFDPDADEEVQS
ncbi:MAG: hypothetical protein OEW60_03150 [Thiovulaceae bacterium]|nr:hypothetical protein [Sulfurimonadaceae bacterium]